MNKRNMRRAGIGGLLIAGLALTGCTVTPEPDIMVLHYTGGAFEGSTFKGCTDPGTRGEGSVNDTEIYLMTSQREWKISRDEGSDNTEGIVVNSKADPAGNPGAQVRVFLKVDFFLNTSCEGGKDSPVVKWWETIGRRFEADVDNNASPEQQSKDAGWINSLKSSIVPSIDRSIQDSARLYTSDDLDSGANDSWAAMEKEIETRLSTDLNANGAFYCGPGYNRDNPSNCPAPRVTITDVELADPNTAAARAAVYAAELQAKERRIKAQAEVEESKILSQAARDPNYMRIRELETQLESVRACASSQNCTIILGTNAAPNVNVGARPNN